MERVPERELMDDERQSIAYANADFSTSNQSFVDRLIAAFADDLRTVADIGCGPGDVVIRLAHRVAGLRVDAIDGSRPMLALARAAVRSSGLEDRITLVEARLPGVPLPDHGYDAVISKDLLHHLPDGGTLWREVMRLGKPGAAVFVMDLMRPPTREAAQAIVDTVAPDEDAILREDFYNSLLAAFTPRDVERQLAETGLPLRVEPVSERHMLVTGRLPRNT